MGDCHPFLSSLFLGEHWRGARVNRNKKMAQLLKVPTAKSDDLSVNPRTHIV